MCRNETSSRWPIQNTSEVTKRQALWLGVHVLLCTTSEQLSALLCSALQGAYKHALVRFEGNFDRRRSSFHIRVHSDEHLVCMPAMP